MTSEKIRELWFSFWESKKHQKLESAPLIPINDDTLLWINSGVAPLKKYFDGTVVPKNRRLVNIQKCIRTNDIENVGYTSRHCTFFEMMGNFSIGDYFKEEALSWAYEFLFDILKFDRKKIYITVYPEDFESKEIWQKLGIEKDHIIELEGNFWEIGVGPSGPDSEIFLDLGPSFDPEKKGIELLKNDVDNDRYIEIWNNVFSMYNADPSKDRSEYDELPSKNIDTGMGFERMCMVLQNKKSVFETDLFAPYIQELEKLANLKYDNQVEIKAIADHIRTVTFAISDGASFGNTGRDYVLRRLLRRAVKMSKRINIEKHFMADLSLKVIEKMGTTYPKLIEKKELIYKLINEEEELFNKTLKKGEKRFEEIIQNTSSKIISGEDAFRLYDTYGFPFELTKELALELGYDVSYDEFKKHMDLQKEQARNARNVDNSMNVQSEELINFNKESIFVGYDCLETKSKVIGLFDGENLQDRLTKGYIVTDETPFYSEKGGQVSDSGVVITNNKTYDIISVFTAPNNQVFHEVNLDEYISLGDEVVLKVDEKKRQNIMKNHSTIHIVHYILRNLFGDSIEQAGSKVDDKVFRFDFTSRKKLSDKDIVLVEQKANEFINKDYSVNKYETKIDKAIEKGVIALFEDKYNDTVRVVEIGPSKELCGGTHIDSINDINRVGFLSFESKGNNVYRVIGNATGDMINQENEYFKKYIEEYRDLEEKLSNINLEIETFELSKSYQDKSNILSINKKAQELLKKEKENKEKEKLLDLLKQDYNFSNNVLIQPIYDLDINLGKELLKELSNKYQNKLICLILVNNNSLNYICKSNTEIDASSIVKFINEKVSGRGGGNKDFAQGGCQTEVSPTDLVDDINEFVKKM